MTNNKNQSTFKKSVLSIVIISTITGGLIALEQYQSEPDFLPTNDPHNIAGLLESSMASTDVQELALIAQANLLSQPQIESELQEQVQYPIEIEQQDETQVDAQQTSVKEGNKASTDQLEPVEGKKMVIENEVLFAFDSSEINPSYFQSLNESAEFMKSQGANNKAVWQVVGYADRTGNVLYNGKLAKRRAQVVAEFLVDKGVAEEQLAIISLGASSPQNAKQNKENNRLDRRVEIHAYQAEITALVEQLNSPKSVQQQLETKNNNDEKGELSVKAEKQEIQPLSFDFKTQSISTAMEF